MSILRLQASLISLPICHSLSYYSCTKSCRTIHFSATGSIAFIVLIPVCIYICSVFSVHSSVSLACFYLLAVVSNGTVTTGVYISFQILVCSDYCSAMGLLDNMVRVVLVF